MRLTLARAGHSLVPTDSRARELLKRHLAESLAAAVRVQVSRVRVLQLRAGSVIVDVSIRPDTSGCDGRTADELLHALQQQAYDETSELSMLWRTALVQHTSIFEAGDPRELGSPSSASSPAVVVDAARAAANPSRSLVKRLFTSSTGAAPDASRGLPAVQAGSLKAASVSETAMPAAIPTEAGGTAALLKRLASQHASEEREPVVPSALLEIVVREAANLPTAEWTRAFCVIKLTDGSRELPRMDLPPDASLLAPEDAAMAIYELQTSGLGGWHVLPGQAAHRTEVIEGMDPEWLETFQFGIVDQAKQELRVQVLHKGFMATEFVGEIRLRVEQVLDLVRQQHDDAGILKNAAKSKVSGGGDHGATIAETELAGFAEEWFPLRTAAKGRVRNRADHDDKHRPPMNGGKSPNKRGDWQKRFFVLDPYTQVLREYLPQEGAGTAGTCLSRMSVRGATVQDVSMRENRAHCHIFVALHASVRHWDELEYACGEGRFQRALGQDQIRASVMLFGVSDFNNQSHGQALRDVMHVQPFCDTLCSFHVLGISKGSLPFGDAPVNVEQSGGGQSGRRVDVPVVTVTFKLVVSNLTSAATQQQLVRHPRTRLEYVR